MAMVQAGMGLCRVVLLIGAGASLTSDDSRVPSFSPALFHRAGLAAPTVLKSGGKFSDVLQVPCLLSVTLIRRAQLSSGSH
jgi:hypothetical protein